MRLQNVLVNTGNPKQYQVEVLVTSLSNVSPTSLPITAVILYKYTELVLYLCTLGA